MFRFLGNLLGRFQRADLHSVESGITVVALVLSGRDRALLSYLAAENGWVIHFARTSDEAWNILNEHKAPIILYDRAMGTDWRGAIRRMASAPHMVCAILISSVADDYLWNEVTMWGGHDVLATPLREENVVRAIRLAWLYRSSASRNEALSHCV